MRRMLGTRDAQATVGISVSVVINVEDTTAASSTLPSTPLFTHAQHDTGAYNLHIMPSTRILG